MVALNFIPCSFVCNKFFAIYFKLSDSSRIKIMLNIQEGMLTAAFYKCTNIKLYKNK